MEIRQMRSFLVVGETLHFRKASEILHLSQPALTLQIQQLEDELGTVLLERSTRSVSLTSAGKTLLERFRSVLSAIDDAQRDTKRVAEGLQGPFHIAYVSTALVSGLLPRAVKLFRERTEGVDLCMKGGAPVDLKKFAKATAITAILPAPRSFKTYGIYSQVQQAYHLAKTEPSQVLQATLLNAVYFVAAGLGIALVPESFRNVPVEGVRYRPLLAPPPPLEFVAVWNQGSNSPLLHQFLSILDEL